MCGEGAVARPRVDFNTGSPPRVWGRRPAVGADDDHRRFTPTCVGKACSRSSMLFSTTVHPHVCGEGAHVAADRVGDDDGSPPRVWGRRGHSGRDAVRRRFTPTCVGKARAWPAAHPRCSVHPHVCGEGVLPSAFLSIQNGSPPRVWGRRSRWTPGAGRCRFTPTCVGKARGVSASIGMVTVHPHVCGEGVVGEPRRQVDPRFTPTCVGKAPGPRRTCRAGTVHPHVCGEGARGRVSHRHSITVHPHVCGEGAAVHLGPPGTGPVHPHVCGEGRVPESLLCGRERFTPTCVGKAPTWNRCTGPGTVHPHVCGEGRSLSFNRLQSLGSPPRVWGRQRRPRTLVGYVRFTPTCVGKAIAVSATAARSGGSPPRVWGRHAHPQHVRRAQRFTPTCVGKAREPRRRSG